MKVVVLMFRREVIIVLVLTSFLTFSLAASSFLMPHYVDRSKYKSQLSEGMPVDYEVSLNGALFSSLHSWPRRYGAIVGEDLQLKISGRKHYWSPSYVKVQLKFDKGIYDNKTLLEWTIYEEYFEKKVNLHASYVGNFSINISFKLIDSRLNLTRFKSEYKMAIYVRNDVTELKKLFKSDNIPETILVQCESFKRI